MDDGALKVTPRDSRRHAIVDVAREVFLSGGFAETSMSAIAARVGGSKGTLYNYFPSKQDLFAAVIQDECDRKQRVLFDTLETSGEDWLAVLKACGRSYATIVLSEESVLLSRAVIAESTRFPELGRVLFEAGPKRGRMRLTVYIEEQMRQGAIRNADAPLMVDQFCEMCLGPLYRQRLMNLIQPPGLADVGHYVDAAVEVIRAAYGGAPARTRPPGS